MKSCTAVFSFLILFSSLALAQLQVFPPNSSSPLQNLSFGTVTSDTSNKDVVVKNTGSDTIYFAATGDGDFLTVVQDVLSVDPGASVRVHFIATLSDMVPGINTGNLYISYSNTTLTFSVTAKGTIPSQSSSTSSQGDGPPSDAFMVDYRDVSLKTISQINGYTSVYKWFRGRTATQVHRDSMEEFLTGVAMPQMIRYERSLPPSCHTDIAFMFGSSGLSSITPRLGPIYELGRALLPAGPDGVIGKRAGGTWKDTIGGRHYQAEIYSMKRVRATSLSNSCATACAAKITPGLLDLLDMRVSNGKCVAGATSFQPIAPQEAFNTTRGENIAIVQSKTRMKPLDLDQLDILLNQIQPNHKTIVNWFCGTNLRQPNFDVHHMLHMGLEMTAKSEAQHHFFTLKMHEFVADSGWGKEDVCRFAILADQAHDQWVQAIINGDWGISRQAENDHQIAHLCMGLNAGDALKVRFSCGQDIYNCPVTNCADLIQSRFGFTQQYGFPH